MDCPVCRSAMVILEYNRVAVDFCFGCQGCWLDQGELGLLLHGTPDRPEELALEAAKNGSRRCPRCGTKMSCGPLAGVGVEADACPAGHGIWLDAGELQAIVKARGKGPGAEALARFCEDVFDAKKPNPPGGGGMP